jgi:hypothetical protein
MTALKNFRWTTSRESICKTQRGPPGVNWVVTVSWVQVQTIRLPAKFTSRYRLRILLPTPLLPLSWVQRVLNDLQKTRLSRLRMMIRLLTHPLPPFRVAGRAYWRETRGGGGRGTKSYDREEAWPSVNYSILSGCVGRQTRPCNSSSFRPNTVDAQCHSRRKATKRQILNEKKY